MTTDIKTHDVALATKAVKPPEPPTPSTPPHPDAKPGVETQTAPQQVQPEGR